MTIAMMIDIETLSLRPDAYVTQVGYCVANLDTGEFLINPLNVWVNGHCQEGRDKDIGTITWWMNQDRKVSAGVFNDTAPKLDPGAVFDMMIEDVEKYEVAEVWASPAMFDLPILTSLWNGEKPWKYNQERCLMTFYKLMDPTNSLQPPPNDLHHDAAADARWQMDYLISLHQAFRATARPPQGIVIGGTLV